MAVKKEQKKIRRKWLQVFQFFAAYLVAAWTFLQFVDWILNRYQVSPYWVDILLWLFVGIIPSLLIYLYHRERLNQRLLRLREKIIFPLNIIIIALGIYIVFGTADLGSTVKEIEYQAADGSMRKRQITKDEFRMVLPIFNFTPDQSDTTELWLEDGIRDLLYLDIHQDKNVNPHIHTAYSTTEKVRQARRFSEFYLDGSYKKSGGVYTIVPSLRNSDNGELVASKTFQGEDLLSLLDSISVYVREEAGISTGQRSMNVDLELREFMSDSLRAIERWVSFDFEKAVAIDSSFAFAYLQLAGTYLRNSTGKDAELKNIEKAYYHRSRLPEDRQLQVLMYKYIVDEDWEKAEELVNIQLKIEPLNTIYIWALSRIYAQTGKMEDYLNFARSQFRKQPNDVSGYNYLMALLVNGKNQEAIDEIEKFLWFVPKDNELFFLKCAPQMLLGDFEEARETLDKAIILRPEWGNITSVYDSTLTYLEQNGSSMTDLGFFEGEFRNPASEQEFRFWVHKGQLIGFASNQIANPLVPAGKTRLMSFLNPLEWLATIDYLSDEAGNNYAIRFNEVTAKSSWTYMAYRIDQSIKKAEKLLAEGEFTRAEIAYRYAIKRNPKHFYLKDALEHVEYIQQTDSISLLQQYQQVVGTYSTKGPEAGPEFWLEDGRLFLAWSGSPNKELLPVSKSRYINMSDMSIAYEFEYECDQLIGGYTWHYDSNTMSWKKSDAPNESFFKDETPY